MSAPKWIVLDADAINIPRILAAMQEGKPSVLSDHAAHEIERQLTHGPGVVVIDPDDISQIRELIRLLDRESVARGYGKSVSPMSVRIPAASEALRSLLTTPKPPEQMGLGAVVEDADGDRWVRAASDHQPWFHMTSDGRAAWLAYADIDVAESVSEGVVTP